MMLSEWNSVIVHIDMDAFFAQIEERDFPWIRGKPVIIGEWSVPAIGPELYGFGEDPFDRPLDWSWPQVVRNQKERGEVYNACMMQLASMDFIVGAGWFKPIDVNSLTRRANRGLINGNFQPYSEMISAIKETHREIKEKMNLKY